MTLKDQEIERLENILSVQRPRELGELRRSLELLLSDYLNVQDLKLKMSASGESTIMLIKVSGITKKNIDPNGYKLS